MKSNKLNTLANVNLNRTEDWLLTDPEIGGAAACLINGYLDGFRAAFKVIEDNLSTELSKLEQYPSMGERIMTLKIYKAKIQNMLVEMEKNYE